ncbi:MAG: DUF721 domain-containing protein [Rickettsiales bacterium]
MMKKTSADSAKRCYLFPKSLEDASLYAITASAEKRGFYRRDIITHWPKIVGYEIARVCTPVRLTFSKTKKQQAILQVTVAPGRSLEIQHLDTYIIQNINRFFGSEIVERLQIFQRNITN